MANLKEIRIRIASVKSTQQITSAMKMVSAAKLKKAQDAITQMRPYAEKLKEMLSDLSSSVDSDAKEIYGRISTEKRILIVAIASKKGLCGAFNANIIKKTLQIANEQYPELLNMGMVDVITVGKKAYEGLKKTKVKIVAQYPDLMDGINFDKSVVVADSIIEGFVDKKYDRIIMVYNHFRNAGLQILTEEQLLPITSAGHGKSSPVNYIFEPNQDEIVKELIPRSLKIQFYKALLDSHASEHGARMTSMHKATDNAGEIIRDLNLTYNKARQAAITNEIVEIVSGANALKS